MADLLKVQVDDELCSGHGRCYEIAPEVFGDDERGHCVVLAGAVPALQETAVRRAEANCPERAIEVVEQGQQPA